MNIHFNIQYNLQYGEDMLINIIAPDGQIRTQRMSAKNDGTCTGLLRLEQSQNGHLDYYYSVERGGQTIRTEWTTQPHRLDLSLTGVQQYTTNDIWQDTPHDTYLYTTAFTQCINRREVPEVISTSAQTILRLKVRAPQLRSFERLAVVGEIGALGKWDTQKAVLMNEIAPNEWIADIDAALIMQPEFEFKFVALPYRNADDASKSHQGGPAILWETGENRHLSLPMLRKGEVMEIELNMAFFEICNVKAAGTLIPVFSLRSEGSFGVGDFGDLKQMIDWIAYTGQRLLQVLPINDSTVNHTWTDSYPYSCISIFALHPQYADLRQLPEIADAKKRDEFETLRKELNALSQIDYELVNNAKNEYLRIIFEQEGKKCFATKEFKEWFAEEQHWLVPYAHFCILRDKYSTADFTKWPECNVWSEENRSALTSPRTKLYKEASYFYYVQFVLAQQMQGAHDYARRCNVILKGDIPIGVNRQGCDAWQEPRYFNLNAQAGAPPDAFSMNGQNWGFPTYNWDAMVKDGCQWWVRRFRNMQKYFDAYRIDHVLGFFRIWEIPLHSVHGLLGQFQPSLGLTQVEIESYGLLFREDFFCRPYITDEVLSEVFGEEADAIAHTYLEPYQGPYYRMKKEYDTQRKIEAALPNTEEKDNTLLRERLYSLVSDVLFLRDHKDPAKFHPRISVQYDFIYKSLTKEEQDAFNRLYDDYFYRRNTHFWYREAMKKLPKLAEATRMLICAEDLGMVPDCVPWVIDELRILSLELQSMPKQPGLEFGIAEQYPYRSVCTIDSHDMPTLRMWWDEDEERAEHYYHNVLYRRDQAPHPMPGWLVKDVINRNLMSPSMLCILSLQDWMGIDEKVRLADANAERINIPANPKHYWRYRMHCNIADLISNQRFCDDIMAMISQSGR